MHNGDPVPATRRAAATHDRPSNDMKPSLTRKDEPMSQHTSDVMTAREVAALLRVNIKTVYDAANQNSIPCRKMGRRVLFSHRAVMAWLETQGRVTLER